ncbi:3-hydroxyacyl-CoA dehydrogenase family protein [Flavihumibacter sp. UBA7668]|uniref:3-hydroxyacyl-CoA dehydrogenase family protein n=1 Tax=Flavihumibacter sp. UBA7668 TaxID=1946542 RepID=UPI0025C0E6B0|nr:3-hydroxyacyl-CoA dehydrogenase family protein [Flavihumibacter sp. UBA7668]
MEKILVIGTGTMGHSIALQAAWCGLEVSLYGLNSEELEKAAKEIHNKLQLMLDKGLIAADELSGIEKRILPVTNLEAAAQMASFIIECIPEVLSLKTAIFKELDQWCSEDVVLASNTSGLLPTAIASNMKHPERFLVTHFWNPAHLVPLVEVVGSPATSASTLERATNLLKKMNKKPILVKKEIPGFVGNRLQFALFREAQFLLESGVASKEDIDAAIRFGIGRRLPESGPLESADMGGLDVYTDILRYLQLCNTDGPLQVLEDLVSDGHYGTKSGTGFYDWTPERKHAMEGAREATLIHFLLKDRAAGL